jgi:transposase
MDLFLGIFGADKIECFLADREFIGKEWISYIIEKNIKFRIRTRNSTNISRANGGSSHARNFFRSFPCNEAVQLDGKRKVFGLMLYVTGVRLSNGEYLIIISSDPASVDQILDDYKKRWEIETLFKALKSQGFDFESTHMVDRKKIDKLMAFLAIAFFFAHKTGEWLHEQKPIKIKSHKRKAISVFRYGLDHLREIFLNVAEKTNQLQEVLILFAQCVPAKLLI